MYSLKFSWLICFAILLQSSQVFGWEDPSFQNTEEEIVQELSKPKPRTRGFTPKITKKVEVLEEEADQMVKKTVKVIENENAPKVNLRVEFDFNSCMIRKSSYPLLEELGKALCNEALEDKSVVINGHADSEGEEGYNLQLSLRRALSIKRYLLAHFPIDEERLFTKGYGESMPLVPNDTPENRQTNRRVEVQLQ